MEKFILSCCSTADLTREHFEAINVSYICFHYEIDGVQYLDDLGQSIPFDEFYSRMAAGAETKTFQVNVIEFEQYFRPFLEQGYDILHVCLFSGITGVINSANIAKQILEEDFPERRIYIVDSLGASSSYGLIMDTLAAKKSEGMGIDELKQWLEEHRLCMHHWFFSMDLSFYIKGGRISKAAGWFGTVFNICPLLNMDNLGRLMPRYKIRGKQKVITAAVDKMAELADDGLGYSRKCYMCHSACLDDAEEIARQIESRFPKLNGKVEINNIGTVIGSHTGPGTISIFFWGQKREDL